MNTYCILYNILIIIIEDDYLFDYKCTIPNKILTVESKYSAKNYTPVSSLISIGQM